MKLIDFLTQLETETAQYMLADLRREDKRGATLYNAINKLLDRHKIKVTDLDLKEDILGELANSLNAYYTTVKKNGLEDDDLFLN